MPNYDFKTLSPADFELLVRDLLTAEYGWRLEAFGHGKDGGVDLRGRADGKKIIVQCKHYAGSTFAELRASGRGEMSKMDVEQPDRYLFVTSQNLSRTQKDTLAGELSKWLVAPADLLTQLDLNELLGRHPNVERQHFKLWLASTAVLERVVRSGVWARSEALMEDISDRVKLYVSNPGYERALRRLDAGHIVVLTGAPGVGKSMLAEMLLLAHWHEGWQVVSVSSDIDEAWDTYRRDEKQVFFYDDFLGQTDISERRAKNEDIRIVRLMARISGDNTKRLVMTTRSQILRQATIISEPIARGNLQLHESIVELADYGPLERAKILYNHLYFSTLPRNAIREYVQSERYWEAIDHENFSPRIVEQVLKFPSLTGMDVAQRLRAALDRPTDLWGTMFWSTLSEMAQRVVLTLVTFAVSGTTPSDLRRATQSDGYPMKFTHALRALEGTFIKINHSAPNSELKVSYANPSVRDFVLATLDDEPRLGLHLIRDAQGLGQIQTLLQYAASFSDGRYKFAALAAEITSEQDVVMRQIGALTEQGIQQAKESEYQSHYLHHAVAKPLTAMLASAKRLLPEKSTDLLKSAVAVAKDVEPGWSDAPSLELLTTAFIESAHGHYGDVKQALYDLICHWGRSLTGIDEIAAFAQFVDAHPGLLSPEFDLDSLLRHYAENALRDEIEAISDNRTDEEADADWINSVEQLAQRIGIGEALKNDIEWERSSQCEHYDQRREWPVPTSGAGVGWVPRESDDSNGADIAALFQQLS